MVGAKDSVYDLDDQVNGTLSNNSKETNKYSHVYLKRINSKNLLNVGSICFYRSTTYHTQ